MSGGTLEQPLSGGAGRPRGRPAIRLALTVLLWGVVVVFAVRVTMRASEDIEVDESVLTLMHLLVWSALLLVARLVDIVGWHLLLVSAGDRVPVSASARVLASAELVRYLPGGVLHFAARYKFARRLGVAPTVVIGATAHDLVLRLGSALAVFAVTLPFWPSVPPGYVVAALVALPLMALGTHPRVVRPVMAKMERRFGGDGSWTVPYSRVLLASAVYASGWLVRGLVGWHMAHAIAGTSASQAPIVVAVMAMAWVVGVVVPFAPGGLGVREGVGVALLSPIMPVSAALAVMLLSRVLTTVVEFVSAPAIAGWDHLARRGAPLDPPSDDDAPDTSSPVLASSALTSPAVTSTAPREALHE